MTHLLTHCLSDLKTSWLIDSLTDWIIDYVTHSLHDSLTDSVTLSPTGLLIDWLTYWVTDWRFNRAERFTPEFILAVWEKNVFIIFYWLNGDQSFTWLLPTQLLATHWGSNTSIYVCLCLLYTFTDIYVHLYMCVHICMGVYICTCVYMYSIYHISMGIYTQHYDMMYLYTVLWMKPVKWSVRTLVQLYKLLLVLVLVLVSLPPFGFEHHVIL